MIEVLGVRLVTITYLCVTNNSTTAQVLDVVVPVGVSAGNGARLGSLYTRRRVSPRHVRPRACYRWARRRAWAYLTRTSHAELHTLLFRPEPWRLRRLPGACPWHQAVSHRRSRRSRNTCGP